MGGVTVWIRVGVAIFRVITTTKAIVVLQDMLETVLTMTVVMKDGLMMGGVTVWIRLGVAIFCVMTAKITTVVCEHLMVTKKKKGF